MALLPSEHTRMRVKPRMTANDLARFMVASDTARLGIIRRARESGTAARIRYSDVRKSIRAHLADPYRDKGILQAAHDLFNQRKTDASVTDFAREDARLSIDVLESFRRMQNQLGSLDFRPPPARNESLVIAEVEIPVNLDAMLVGAGSGRDRIGGALFRFTKADDETDIAAARRREMGVYAATIVFMHVEQAMNGLGDPDPKLSMSVDVQAQEIHVAPRARTQKITNLTSACQFIAGMWDRA